MITATHHHHSSSNDSNQQEPIVTIATHRYTIITPSSRNLNKENQS